MFFNYTLTDMNTNKGIDPMLSSFVGDSIWNTKIIADVDIPSGQFLPLTSSGPISPVPDSMLSSSEINNSSFTDLASLWNTERKRVTSVKIEEDEGFSDVGSSEMDMEDDDIIKENISIADDASVIDSGDEFVYKSDCNNFLVSSEAEARRYVEEKFSQTAHVPNVRLGHKEKIQYILSLSDCTDYTVDQILSLDKKSSESARICSKIVQNIPQRYRWEFVKPEQIPCCYTIVADCKKSCTRDKPPRPMNAFMIWAQGARRLINELCPKMQNAHISESLGYFWRQKSDSFKKKFELEKVKLRRFHNVEFPAYKYKPKTKVQKAKEKEELSLSKVKLAKTAPKRKRSCDITNNKEPTGRKGRCGRPKKIKLASVEDQPKLSKSSEQQLHTDEPVKMSPTKPAIKDMLTLKILNDRRTKEMAVINSPPRENVQHSLGQLSPVEIESPHTSDIFDELRDLESVTTNTYRGKEVCSHNYLSSSVYDTPANTPPVDMDDDISLSPVQLHKSHSSYVAKPTSTSPSTVHQNPPLSCPPKNNKCLLSPQASMPSLTAILSSGRHIPVRESPTAAGMSSIWQPILHRDTPPLLLPNRNNSRISSTDVILSCVSEILDFPDSKNKQSDFQVRDNNNNNSNGFYDVNNNNNNGFRSFESFNSDNTSGNSLSGLFNPKLSMYGPPKVFDFNDLDTLCLDPNVPLLSDDIMSSLMNTL